LAWGKKEVVFLRECPRIAVLNLHLKTVPYTLVMQKCCQKMDSGASLDAKLVSKPRKM
jgi:hypothetical protein